MIPEGQSPEVDDDQADDELAGAPAPAELGDNELQDDGGPDPGEA